MLIRLAAMLLATLAAGAAGAAPVVLPADQHRIALGSHLEYLEDRRGRFDIGDVLAADGWAPNVGIFSRGYSRSVWWLRATVSNSGDAVESRLLEVGSPLLDQVDVYVADLDGTPRRLQLGENLAFRERPIGHQNFLVPLVWQPGQTLAIYIRLHSTSSLQVPLALWDEHAFVGIDHTRSLMAGLLFGAIVLIALYNLMLYGALRDRVYLHYVGYTLSMAVFLASLGGYSYRYLWPRASDWNDRATVLSLVLLVLFAALFARRLLIVATLSRALDRAARLFIGLALVLLPAALLLPYRVSIGPAIALATALSIWGAVTGALAWWRGRPAGKYYTLAWATLFVGGIALMLSKTGLLPTNLLTMHGLSVGVALEVLLLALAVADRINVERRLRDRAQRLALAAVGRANAELERRVDERSRELDELNAQLRRLSETDQLTGLWNRRHLMTRLAGEWARGSRSGQMLAVLICDIDYFKRINDTYGHAAGDACLRAVARRLRDCADRPADEVARYGGEEFCIVLPETDLEGGLAVAERVRAAIAGEPVRVGRADIAMTISVGVAAAAPHEASDPGPLLRAADQALYAAKAAGRNRVAAAGSPAATVPARSAAEGEA